MEEISGSEAIAIMRKLRKEKKSHFLMHHLTYNEKKDKTNGLRVVSKCRLRAALPDEVFKMDSDLYLPYTDLDLHEARMAFKKLIRIVAFPPHFKLLKVNWFKKK